MPMYLFSKNASTAQRTYALWLNTSGDINLNVNIDGFWAAINTRLLMVSTTRWLPISAVYNGDYLRIYYRGQAQEGVDHRSGAVTGSTAEVHVGSWNVSPVTDTFDGAMDDVLFFDRELTRWEIEYWALHGLDEIAGGIIPVMIYDYRRRRT